MNHIESPKEETLLMFSEMIFKTSIIFQHRILLQEELHFAPYLKQKNDFLQT